MGSVLIKPETKLNQMSPLASRFTLEHSITVNAGRISPNFTASSLISTIYQNGRHDHKNEDTLEFIFIIQLSLYAS